MHIYFPVLSPYVPVSSIAVMSGCDIGICFQSFVSMLELMSKTDLVALGSVVCVDGYTVYQCRLALDSPLWSI